MSKNHATASSETETDGFQGLEAVCSSRLPTLRYYGHAHFNDKQDLMNH